MPRLSLKVSASNSSFVGGGTTPFCQLTATVSPSYGFNADVISYLIVLPFCSGVQEHPVAPAGPEYPECCMIEASSGRTTVTSAFSIANIQSFPVTFQYTSS